MQSKALLGSRGSGDKIMGRKIFVSYKHSDSSVQYLSGYGKTARAYVDHLIENGLDDEIYKGEGNEDLTEFKEVKNGG